MSENTNTFHAFHFWHNWKLQSHLKYVVTIKYFICFYYIHILEIMWPDIKMFMVMITNVNNFSLRKNYKL